MPVQSCSLKALQGIGKQKGQCEVMQPLNKAIRDELT